MPGPIPAFQLLDVLINGLLDELAARLVATFERAADLLPEELPRRAEFGPGDEGEVMRAVRAAVARAGLHSAIDAMATQFEQVVSRFNSEADFEVPGAALDQLVTMVQSTTRRVTELGQRTDADVQRVLALAVREPLSAVELADGLRSALKAEGQYARTLVETELKAAQRMLAVNVGQTLGMDRLGYLGPVDRITRPFCEHMAGWWYTVEMLAACDNGQLPDVVVTGGGYNCRHAIIPATEGMVRRTFPGKLVIGWEAVAGEDDMIWIDVQEAA